jgi:hypothetical protein
MTNVHEAIEEILKRYGKAQTNLSSEAAQKMITNEICNCVLSKTKTDLLDEIKALRDKLKKSAS